MEIGKLSDGQLAHMTATAEILRLAKEHPDYPITVLVGEEANTGDYSWEFATRVSVGIEEILDCETEWWQSDYVCTDRDEFEAHAQDRIWDKLKEELGREPTDEEQEAAWKAVKEAHEPYWKKCIAIRADK